RRFCDFSEPSSAQFLQHIKVFTMTEPTSSPVAAPTPQPGDRILSGIQPTADSYHLANYLVALKQWIDLQYGFDAFYVIPDMQAITVEQDQAELRERTIAVAAQLIALGIYPKRSTLYVQSHVPARAELTWVLQCMIGLGKALSMTQFKDKATRQGQN